jgi:hypothetical protein
MKIRFVCLAPIRDQISTSHWSNVNLQVLEQVLWQRSLDAIRDRQRLFFFCEIDSFDLADGLRGNSRLQSLTLYDSREGGNREALAIAGALRENKGLVVLNLRPDLTTSHETWNAVCDSLKTHPTLQVLSIRNALPWFTPSTSAVLNSRIQALVDMLEVNTSIRTLRVDSSYAEDELFRESVYPYLETNRFRPRLLAIQKTRSIAYRVKVLGRALLATRTNPNSFWMLLSGNAEVAFPSTTATTAPAGNLPTPATAAPTVNVVTVGSATAVSNIVAPAAGQKRKTCP